MQILEFLSFSLISGFQDLINQFLRFDPCTNFWHLWNFGIFLFDFSIIFLLFPWPSLLDHDLLCWPLPDECLPLPLRALQSR